MPRPNPARLAAAAFARWRRLPWQVAVLLLSVLVPIAATGYIYYLEQKEASEQAARQQINAIGDLKAQEISRWLQEHRRYAATLYYGTIDPLLDAYLANPHVGRLKEETFKWLSSLAANFGFHELALLDGEGRILAAFPSDALDLSGAARGFVVQALQTRLVVFSDVYGDTPARIDFVVPLLGDEGRLGPPAGVLVLRIDPGYSLFPLLRTWPTASPTGETLMVRREGDLLEFLSPLRHRQDEPLTMSAPDLASAMSLNAGDVGRQLDAVDYRGKEVLAAIRPIHDSPWSIIAKVDRDEINDPIRESGVRTLLIVVLLMLVAILTIWAAWRRQTELMLREAKTALEAANASLVAEISEREFYEAQLEHQANYDALTSLPNRSLLQNRLNHAIDQARQSGHRCAVLFVDLDRFKTVNDSLGHPTGDILLKEVAQRLKHSVRDHDTVARRGGDEFVIVLDNIAHSDIAEVVAKKLLMGLSSSFKVGEFEVFVTCSIGISIFPRDGEEAETLVSNADIAMYYAKERGRNIIEYYDQYMNARSLERLLLENNLRHALDGGELEVYYQPQTDLASGRIVGVEALLRWRHPVLNVLSPEDFVPLAEETGLIVPMGKWVLETACAQLKKWQDEGLPILFVAVNLSARQFMQPELADFVAETLSKSNLEPSCLELEITESMIMNDVEGVIGTLNVLKSMGVQLAIDDFGTGYASLNYLKRFPVDCLKIDKSFVRDIATDPGDAAITVAVISMAHSLQLRVVAEGVETEAQLSFLKSKQCDEMQGYFFSRPLRSYEVSDLLRANRIYH